MKKIFIVFLISFLVFTSCAQVVKADWLMDKEGLERLDSEISKYEDKLITVDISKCKVPQNKYGIKVLPEETFARKKNIKKIIFANDVEMVSYRQFGECENLKEVVFPAKIKYFSNYVFSGCKSLKKIVLPSIIESGEIPLSIFFDCESLEEIVMPENLKWLSCQTYREKLPSTLKKITFSSYPLNILSDSSPSAGSFFYESDYNFSVVTPSGTKSYNEFYNDCYEYSMVLRPKAIEFASVTSSSELSDKYKAENVSSGDWSCWIEGKNGSGENEWIEFQFSEPTTIYMISFKNGFGNLAYFWKNNRIKDFELILDDDFENPIKLQMKDNVECQNVYLELNDKTYSKMRLIIKSVYKGTDSDDDTCLDEFAVNVAFSRDSLMEWDVLYSTGEKGYAYDPETARMLKELYIMDVGAEKVGSTKDGLVTVKATDWEMGTEYTTVIPGALTGTLFRGFWPGTGGGHEYHKYRILLMENGHHLLAEWLDYGDGIVSKHSLDDLYIWKDQKWISFRNPSIKTAGYGIENLVELINWLDQRNIRWDFYVEDDSITISPRIVETYGGNYCRFTFKYDTKKVYEYTKEPANLIVKGSAEELKNIPDWKSQIPDEYLNANMLVVAAAFNSDPSMVEYLLESGYSVNEPFLESEYYGKQTPLEACLYYENKSVLQVLLDNGASYSPQIVIDAMDRRNLQEVEKYVGLINSYDKVLTHVSRIYSDENRKRKKDIPGTLEYIKKLIAIFKSKGIDINAYVSDDEKGRQEYHSLCGDAILTMDLDYIKTCVQAGCKIPDQIEAYGDPTPVEYVIHEYLYGEDDDPEIIERRKKYKPVIDYLISQGATVNAPEGKTEWYTALYEICSTEYWQQSKIDMIKFLIQNGCDINIRGSNGETALSKFYKYNSNYMDQDYQKQVLKLLLDNGADTVDVLFKLSYSEGSFNRETFDLFFSYMKDVTYVSRSENRTLLTFILSRYGLNEDDYYVLKQILSRDFNMYAKNSGETYSQSNLFLEFIKDAMFSELESEKILELYDLFIKHGANVNEKGSYGTALNECFDNFRVWRLETDLKLIENLIDDGAEVVVKNIFDEDLLTDFFRKIDAYKIGGWDDVTLEQADSIVKISKIMIKNGATVSKSKMKKYHVPNEIIKRIL